MVAVAQCLKCAEVTFSGARPELHRGIVYLIAFQDDAATRTAMWLFIVDDVLVMEARYDL